MNISNLEPIILGMLMLNSTEDIIQVHVKIGRLDEKYFTIASYRNLFVNIKKLVDQYQSADAISLLSAYPEYEDKSEWLINMQSSFATSITLDSHIIQLKEAWAKTEFKHISDISHQDVIDSVNMENTIIEHESKLKILKEEVKRVSNQSISSILKEAEAKAQEDKSLNVNDLVSYAMPKVRDHVHVYRGQVHIIGGASGLGKTAFCLSCMKHQAMAGINTVYLCCESKALELYQRLACLMSTSSYINMTKGFPYGGQSAFLQALNLFKEYQDNLQIYGKDNYEHTVESIEQKLWEIQRTTRLDMVYIDYLQMMKMGSNKYKKQFEVYELIIEEIGRLAVKYNCAITVLSQLNRNEKDEDGRHNASNLRGSSSFENVAHIISFLHQEKEIKKDTKLRVKETFFYSAKCRLISPFNLRLAYDSYCGNFTDSMSDAPFPWNKQQKPTYQPYKN